MIGLEDCDKDRAGVVDVEDGCVKGVPLTELKISCSIRWISGSHPSCS